MVALLNDQIYQELGIRNAVLRIVNQYIYLSEDAKGRAQDIALLAEQTDPFAHVYTSETVRKGSADELITLLNMGFQSRAAGDLAFQLQPNAIFYGPYGSTHGTGYTYDTHVPFLLLGYGVEPGMSHGKQAVTDIVDIVARIAQLPYAPNSLVR